MKTRTGTLALLLALLPAAAALAQVNLVSKRREGTSSRVTTFRSQQLLTIAGQQIPTKGEITSTVQSIVGRPLADETTRVQQKVTAVSIRSELPGGVSIVFDSAKPEEAKSEVPQIQAALDAFRKLAGSTYTLVAGKDGRITAVQGLEGSLDGLSDMGAAVLKTLLDPEKLKKGADQAMAVAPGKPVKVGDTWQRTEDLFIGGGQVLSFETHFEYAGPVEKNGRKLEKFGVFVSAVKYTMEPNNAAGLTVERSELKIESASGSVLFDPELGTVAERSTLLHIKGPVSLSLNGMALGAEVDLNLELSERLLP